MIQLLRGLLLAEAALLGVAGCTQVPVTAPTAVAKPASAPVPVTTPAANSAPQVAARAGSAAPAPHSAPAAKSTAPAGPPVAQARSSPAPRPAAAARASAPKPGASSAPSAAPATAAPPAPLTVVAPRPSAPALDLASLEQRLRDTKAIGVFTKLSLKNQVDDLLSRFRDFYSKKGSATLAELHQKYDLLVLKVLSVLQDGDPALASAISSSREAIWSILADPQKFGKL